MRFSHHELSLVRGMLFQRVVEMIHFLNMRNFEVGGGGDDEEAWGAPRIPGLSYCEC